VKNKTKQEKRDKGGLINPKGNNKKAKKIRGKRKRN